MTAMRTMRFEHDTLGLLSFEVPADAHPFGVNAVCPSCNPDIALCELPEERQAAAFRDARRVDAIDYNVSRFWCVPSHPARLIRDADRAMHPIPRAWFEIEPFEGGAVVTIWRDGEARESIRVAPKETA